MKQELIGLTQRYVTALRKHLKPGPRSNLQPALRLRRQAVALGLETPELARIHERSRTPFDSRRRIAPRKLLQAQLVFCFVRVYERMLLNEN